MPHIKDDRLHDFANESLADLTTAENEHLDECSTCWSRLVVAVQLVMMMHAELKISPFVFVM
jgi:hypothetical protein